MTPPRWELSRAAGFCAVREKKNRTLQKRPVLLFAMGSLDQACVAASNAAANASYIPDPSLEKHKKLLVYDPSIHDYSVDKPVWEEIANGHFVYGNQRELEGYRKEYESQL